MPQISFILSATWVDWFCLFHNLNNLANISLCFLLYKVSSSKAFSESLVATRLSVWLTHLWCGGRVMKSSAFKSFPSSVNNKSWNSVLVSSSSSSFSKSLKNLNFINKRLYALLNIINIPCEKKLLNYILWNIIIYYEILWNVHLPKCFNKVGTIICCCTTYFILYVVFTKYGINSFC